MGMLLRATAHFMGYCLASTYVFAATLPLPLWRAKSHYESFVKEESQWIKEREKKFQQRLLKDFQEYQKQKYGTS